MALPNRDERPLGVAQRFREADPVGDELAQGLGAGAEMLVRVGQIDPLADQADRQGRGAPTLADAHVEKRGFGARVRADEEHRVRLLDPGDRRVEDVGGAPVGRRQNGAVLPPIEVRRAEALHQQLEGVKLLHRREVAGDRPDARRIGPLHLPGDGRERLAPGSRAEPSALPQVGPVEPLHPQAVNDVAGLVRDPLLVDGLVDARLDPHDLAPA
jgi:hypothetical protein